MDSYSKRALIKQSVKLAKEKHPRGFNKSQLVAASKEVFGGFGTNPLKKISSEDDVDHKRNAMALIDGHYPLLISDCEVVGISGDCGLSCPVFQRGDCLEHKDKMISELIKSDEFTEEEVKEICENYS